MCYTKRYIITKEILDTLPISEPVRYERYYIHDRLRIQKKGNVLERERLDDANSVIEKSEISLEEFEILKIGAYNQIIRDSYLHLPDIRVSIKEYREKYLGLIRVEVKLDTEEEVRNYQKENWMLMDITNSLLAFDKDLSKLSSLEFQKELKKYSRMKKD